MAIEKVTEELAEEEIEQPDGLPVDVEIEGEEKDLDRFLVDVQEELMDALLYIEAARRCLTDEVEEVMFNRAEAYEKNI